MCIITIGNIFFDMKIVRTVTGGFQLKLRIFIIDLFHSKIIT